MIVDCELRHIQNAQSAFMVKECESMLEQDPPARYSDIYPAQRQATESSAPSANLKLDSVMCNQVMSRFLAITVIGAMLTSCATVGMMPKSAAEIDFDGKEGKTGWSEYKHVEIFRDQTIDDIYAAAKVGLGDAGFSLRQADKSLGYVIGEHGMTAHDWNIISGVYFVADGNDVKVAVIAEGSKDIGFSGDVTSDGWTGKILKSMREYLNDTQTSILRVDRNDLK